MNPAGRKTRRRLSYEARILLLTLAGGFPAVVALLLLLWTGDYTPKVIWTLTLVAACCWLGFAFSVRGRVVRPLQTSSNLLAALREGDFSVRARGSAPGDALNGVFQEVNELSETLREQRLGALEATNLLRTVMAEIDVAVFTFDDEQRLRLVNRAGERLLNQPAERLLGRTAAELGLASCLGGPHHEPRPMEFPGGAGRWSVRVSSFREHGRPHQLLLLSDLTRPLRAEEVQAWKRLVRVLGHELNNSLAPIMSIASSLKTLVDREPLPGDWREDVDDGLSVISGRAESLGRFMSAYARLARLPEPKPGQVDVDSWVRRNAELERRLRVELVPGPALFIPGDGDQLDQLLINLIRNAADAALETGGSVRAGWRRADSQLEVWVEDEGPGLSNTANLFVPFFTTKPGGSGIGLALCRQIAEAHNGTLTLENRKSGHGCEARLALPL
ncbi:MAG: PAS domain-containing protein [Bryobacteraceae bacterium]|nr:PAS domain-containing protein [Bryobacteraceae bacterium]